MVTTQWVEDSTQAGWCQEEAPYAVCDEVDGEGAGQSGATAVAATSAFADQSLGAVPAAARRFAPAGQLEEATSLGAPLAPSASEGVAPTVLGGEAGLPPRAPARLQRVARNLGGAAAPEGLAAEAATCASGDGYAPAEERRAGRGSGQPPRNSSRLRPQGQQQLPDVRGSGEPTAAADAAAPAAMAMHPAAIARRAEAEAVAALEAQLEGDDSAPTYLDAVRLRLLGCGVDEHREALGLVREGAAKRFNDWTDDLHHIVVSRLLPVNTCLGGSVWRAGSGGRPSGHVMRSLFRCRTAPPRLNARAHPSSSCAHPPPSLRSAATCRPLRRQRRTTSCPPTAPASLSRWSGCDRRGGRQKGDGGGDACVRSMTVRHIVPSISPAHSIWHVPSAPPLVQSVAARRRLRPDGFLVPTSLLAQYRQARGTAVGLRAEGLPNAARGTAHWAALPARWMDPAAWLVRPQPPQPHTDLQSNRTNLPCHAMQAQAARPGGPGGSGSHHQLCQPGRTGAVSRRGAAPCAACGGGTAGWVCRGGGASVGEGAGYRRSVVEHHSVAPSVASCAASHVLSGPLCTTPNSATRCYQRTAGPLDGCYFTLAALRGEEQALARRLVQENGGRLFTETTLQLVGRQGRGG